MMSTLTTTTQHRLGSPRHTLKKRKIKDILIGKEEVKVSLFTNDVLDTENPTDETRKLLELINKS